MTSALTYVLSGKFSKLVVPLELFCAFGGAHVRYQF